MSSHRCVMLALAALLAFSTSAIDGRSLPGSPFYNGAFPAYTVRSFTASAADDYPCSVVKYDMEVQAVDDTYRVCEVKLYGLFCDGHSVLPFVLYTELPCDKDMDPMECPDEHSLPLFAINSTVHYHDDGQTCDFDVNTRVLCDAKCLKLLSTYGTSTCEAPKLPVDVKPCD